MPSYMLGSINNATVAGQSNPGLAQLWNPSSTVPLWVTRIIAQRAATTTTLVQLALSHSTARGTPTLSVTPTIVNDVERKIAPPSGAILDVAPWTNGAQPLVDTTNVRELIQIASITGLAGHGFELVFAVPRIVKPGTGLLIYHPGNLVCASMSWCWFWDE